MSLPNPVRAIDLSNRFKHSDNHVYKSSSPCVLALDNSYLVVIRCNYVPHFYERTLTQIMELDLNFAIVKQSVLSICEEDIRIFKHGDIIYYMGINKYWDSAHRYAVVAGIWTGFEINNTIPVRVMFDTHYTNEKNWAFFSLKGDLRVVYQWYPLKICRLDFDSNELHLLITRPMPDSFERFCGSSCGVTIENEIWFTVHLQDNRAYKHAFVIFDKDMNLLRYSEPVGLIISRSFSYGLHIKNNRVLLGFSLNDYSTYIHEYTLEGLQTSLKWHTCVE